MFAADNIPNTMRQGSFSFVNASKAKRPGTHWTLYKEKTKKCYCWPVELPLESYKNVVNRIVNRMKQLFADHVAGRQSDWPWLEQRRFEFWWTLHTSVFVFRTTKLETFNKYKDEGLNKR